MGDQGLPRIRRSGEGDALKRLLSSERGSVEVIGILMLIALIVLAVVWLVEPAFFLAMLLILGAIALLALVPQLRAPPQVLLPILMMIGGIVLGFIAQGQSLSLTVARLL